MTNTFPKGIAREKKKLQQKMVLAVRRALEVIRINVVPLIPRITGRLVGSYQGNAKVPGDSVFNIEEKPMRVIGVIGTNVEYGKFVEFGTSRQRPQFPFTRGFESAKPAVNTVIQTTLKL